MKTQDKPPEKIQKNVGELIDADKAKGLNPLKSIHHFLHGQPTAISAIILVLTIIVFGMLVGKRFLDPFNLSLILQQVTIIGILGVAQTLIILTAGIDLSVGAIMVLTSVVMGKAGMEWGIPTYLAILIGLGVGFLAGMINGVLIAKMKLPPFIATLGTWSIFYALNLWYSESQTIRSQDISEYASLLQFMGTPVVFLGARLTYGSIFMVLLMFLFWYILRFTAWGRHLYATGDDPSASMLAGIHTDKIKISTYAIGGLICGLCGWALIGRIGSISPQAGGTANLDSITAVVIGGTSLFGGRGSIIGTLMGALTVGVFRNGLALAGVDVLWQEFTVGLLIIIAVGLDQWIRKIAS